MGREENEARKLKEFRNKLTTREDVQELLQLYDDRRVKGLEFRLSWLELPLWRRAWITVSGWWAKEVLTRFEQHVARRARAAWFHLEGWLERWR